MGINGLLVMAVRQYKHNDGSDGFVTAYDKSETDKVFSAIIREYTKLSEALESIQEMQLRTPDLPENYSHEDVALLNDRIDEIFGKVNETLSKLWEK